MAFPEAGHMNTVKEIGADYGNKAMCADSRLAVAGTTVCAFVLLYSLNIAVCLTQSRALLLFSAVMLVALPSTSAFLRESEQRIKLQRIDAANMALDTLHALGLQLILTGIVEPILPTVKATGQYNHLLECASLGPVILAL